MNLLDIVIVVAVSLVAYLGRKRSPLKQLVAVTGLVASVWLAVIAYRQLAFLTEQSGMRVVVLLLLVVAAGLLAYDISFHLGEKLVRGVARRIKLPPRTAHMLSALVSGVGALIVVWLTTGVLSGSQLVALRQQVMNSVIVAGLNDVAQPPAPFRQVAHLLGPFSSPQVFVSQEPVFDGDTTIATEFADLDDVTENAKASVLKVSAWGCGSTTVGSGFVVPDSLIVTNAHVVAGADRISVQSTQGTFSALPVFFDPRLDMAVLRTATELDTPSLSFRNQLVDAGTISSVLGYPGGDTLMTSDGIIVSTLNARGYDIYSKDTVVRQIYAFRGRIVPGNSGGPLVDNSGMVIGLIFGSSPTQTSTGFALPSPKVREVLRTVANKTATVSTGTCTGQ